MRRLTAALLMVTIPGMPQGFTVGVKGGLRLTGDTPPYAVTSDSKRYVVGAAVEVGLPFGFAFDAEALYSRLGNTFYIPLIANESDIRTIANSWTFPLLLKYRLPERRTHPFVSAGIAPRHAGGSIHTIHYGFYSGDITFSSVDWHAHDHALVLGGGVAVNFGRIRLAPEIRYLRWHVPPSPSPSDTAYYLRTGNEAQLLLAIAWGSSHF
jgi:hypothetical protein